MHIRSWRWSARQVTGWRAIELVRTLKPGVVVMDVNMPRCDGVQANQTDQGGISGDPHSLAVSMHNSSDMVERMQQAGARGYLTKRECRGQLCRAIGRRR